MSPENTIFFVTPPSVSQISMLAEPSRCPTSVKRILTPSLISTFLPYAHGTMFLMMPSASSMVYAGSTSGSPECRFAFLFFHSASCIWICAQSRSMMEHRSADASVVNTCPRNPLA